MGYPEEVDIFIRDTFMNLRLRRLGRSTRTTWRTAAIHIGGQAHRVRYAVELYLTTLTDTKHWLNDGTLIFLDLIFLDNLIFLDLIFLGV